MLRPTSVFVMFPMLAVSAAFAVDRQMFDLPRVGSASRVGPTMQGTLVERVPSISIATQIATINPVLFSHITFGDTDHDGFNEAIMYVSEDGNFHYRILEEQGGNLYIKTLDGPQLLPYAVGDLDDDGKSEVIGQLGSTVYVYESVLPSLHPTTLVWSSPSLSSIIGALTIGDTDRDGSFEIVHSVNAFAGSSALVIYESTGDNQFSEVFYGTVGSSQNHGEKVIADFDGDSLVEIAFAGGAGHVHVYESPGDNQWAETWTLDTDLLNGYGAEGGVDTDGNGKPEIFIAGEISGMSHTIVYEASGNDVFCAVDTIVIPEVGDNNALGDWDGDGIPEYVVETETKLTLFRPEGIGNWIAVGEILNPENQAGVQMFDVNKNGYDEIFWDRPGQVYPGFYTFIYEFQQTSDVGDSFSGRRSRLVLRPNPFTAETMLQVDSWTARTGTVAVFDVAGRLVARQQLTGSGSYFRWRPDYLVPGVYFVRLHSPAHGPTAIGRAVLVR